MPDLDANEVTYSAEPEGSKKKSAMGINIIAKVVIISFSVMFFIGIVSAIALYIYFSSGLPRIYSIQDYKPSIVSKVISTDGEEIAEFYVEKRHLIEIEKLPKHVIDSFVAAEDDRFFEHEGLDFTGILRAAIANIQAGRVVQGGSTITQQVAKSFLTSKRTLKRKIQEAILSTRIESNLGKKDILYLYLNQIYLGSSAYGVESAARTYYNKSATELSIPEAALLAGLPQAPSKYSPLKNPELAIKRQKYVLQRLYETDKITEVQYRDALKTSLKIFRDTELTAKSAPYFSEHVRRQLIEKYGSDKLYKEGLTIHVTMNHKLQNAAQKAIINGLEEIDKRQGFRGAIKNIPLNDKPQVVEELKTQKQDIKIKSKPFFEIPENTMPTDLMAASASEEANSLIIDETYRSIVTRIDDRAGVAQILTGTLQGEIPIESMRWAQPAEDIAGKKWRGVLKRVSRILKPGDVILTRYLGKEIPEKFIDKNKKPLKAGELEKEKLYFALEQKPKVQGALVSIDPENGHVLAMIGGYNFKDSEFNRAIQAKRQPGSAFKPLIFASAIEAGYAPNSILVDSPESLEGAEEELSWKPHNYDGKFKGEITLRQSLEQSRNIPTIKLFMKLGLNNIINFSKRLGLEGEYPKDLSLALGSLSVSPLDITKVYTTFANGGKKITPMFISKVLDRDGNILEENGLSVLPDEMNLNSRLDPTSEIKTSVDAAVNIQNQEPAQEQEAIQNSETRTTEAALDKNGNPIENLQSDVDANPDADEKLTEDEIVPLKYNANSIRFEDENRLLDEKHAFLISNLLTGVVKYGTARKALTLKRPLAGKTGTTNDYIDAWFIGYSPKTVTGVWTGRDEQVPMGYGETGSKSALPIWVSYMEEALKEEPFQQFNIPPGIVFVPIEKASGKHARAESGPGFLEAFIAGSEPLEFDRDKKVESLDFFKEDLAE